MAEFDYMNAGDQGLIALGGAAQGFAKGLMDAEDRSYKKMEMEAKAKAQDEERSRNAFHDAMEQRKFDYQQQHDSAELDVKKQTEERKRQDDLFGQGYALDENGNKIDRKLTPREMGKNKVDAASKGLLVTYDANGNPVTVKQDPNFYRVKAAEGAAESRAIRNKYMGERLDETRNQNAAHSGEAFEKDAILKLSKTNANSLKRSLSILDNPNKPVTTKDLNLAYTDYINAVAAGGAATEGKIGRELPESYEAEWNILKQKFGVNDDLRKSKAGLSLINMLKENINTVNHDIGDAVAGQAYSLHNNYIQNSNPKVQETVRQKLKMYAPEKYNELYGQGEAPSGLLKSGLTGPEQKGLVQPPMEGAPPPSGQVRVSNGTETYLIDPKDLADAKKDGFKVVP